MNPDEIDFNHISDQVIFENYKKQKVAYKEYLKEMEKYGQEWVNLNQ